MKSPIKRATLAPSGIREDVMNILFVGVGLFVGIWVIVLAGSQFFGPK
jgi:hypothetical protein